MLKLWNIRTAEKFGIRESRAVFLYQLEGRLDAPDTKKEDSIPLSSKTSSKANADNWFRQAVGKINSTTDLSSENRQWWESQTREVSDKIANASNPDVAETVAKEFFDKAHYYTGPVLTMMKEIEQSCGKFMGGNHEHFAGIVRKAAANVSDSTALDREVKLATLKQISDSSKNMGELWSESHTILESVGEIGGKKMDMFSGKDRDEYTEKITVAIRGDGKTVDPAAALKRVEAVHKEIMAKQKERKAALDQGNEAIGKKKKILSGVGYFRSLGMWEELAEAFATDKKKFPDGHPIQEFLTTEAQEATVNVQVAFTAGLAELQDKFDACMQSSSSWEAAQKEHSAILQSLDSLPKGFKGKARSFRSRVEKALQTCNENIEGKGQIAGIRGKREQLEQSGTAKKSDYEDLQQELQSIPSAIRQERLADWQGENTALKEAIDRLEKGKDDNEDLDTMAETNSDIAYVLTGFETSLLDKDKEGTPSKVPSIATKDEITEQKEKEVLKKVNTRQGQNLSTKDVDLKVVGEVSDTELSEISLSEIDEESITVENSYDPSVPSQPPKKSITIDGDGKTGVNKITTNKEEIRKKSERESVIDFRAAIDEEQQTQITDSSGEKIVTNPGIVIKRVAETIFELNGGIGDQEKIETRLKQRSQKTITKTKVRENIVRRFETKHAA